MHITIVYSVTSRNVLDPYHYSSQNYDECRAGRSSRPRAAVRHLAIFAFSNEYTVPRFYDEGFKDGTQHGRLHGLIEGRALGKEKGFEMWEEVGFHLGFATVWRAILLMQGDPKCVIVRQPYPLRV